MLCLFAGALALAVPVRAQADSACASCHEEGKKIAGSTHASTGCAACHPKHEKYPHPAGVPKPACAECHTEVADRFAVGVHGQERKKGNESAPDCGVCHGSAHETKRPSSLEFRQQVPETCGMCHDTVAKEYLESVHGRELKKGVRETALCTDCHGEHSILRPKNAQSSVNRAQIRETCARCHGDVRLSSRFGLPSDRILSFDSSFHGLAAKAGSQSVANCASCHGYHNILPSSDPKSMTNTRNLPATCGKCHPGAGTRFAIGTIHWTEEGKPPQGVAWVRDLYVFLIPLTIGLMAIHNLGDFLRKVWRLRLRPGAASYATTQQPAHGGPLEMRMYWFERVQHAIMVVSFAVLVWTGFALKYPDEWWALPLRAWEAKFALRGTIHRIAGAVMIGASLVHIVALSVDRSLRAHWLEMLPRASDVREALSGFAYRIGFGSKPPYQSAHSYIEKAEYWAVAWGTAVMAVTGVLLWAVRYTLAWLPKTWLDVATAVHFYEAVLATLAIVVWHFYSVIFDPDVYPVDTAWLNGYGVKKHRAHEDSNSTRQTQ